MINVIAVIICSLVAGAAGAKKEWGWLTLQLIMVAANLVPAIFYLRGQ